MAPLVDFMEYQLVELLKTKNYRIFVSCHTPKNREKIVNPTPFYQFMLSIMFISTWNIRIPR